MTVRRVAMSQPSRPRWLMPLALLAVFCCTPTDTVPALDLDATTVTDRVQIFLISPEDNGATGRKVGCGDSAVPVEVALPSPTLALEGSLQALLAHDSRYDSTTGLYNPLYASPLEVEVIQYIGAEARVRLKGYIEVGGDCDGPRMLAQLTETALQFPDVQQVFFYLGDKPLRDLLGKR